MLVLKVNENKVNCPVCWEEMIVRTYQRLKTEAKEGDHAVKVFSILTDTDFNKVWEAEAEDLEAAIYQATAFVFNQSEEFRMATVPKYFNLGGRQVLIPGKISRLTVGQNFVMRGELAKARKEGRPLESMLSIALAVYLQPLVDVGPFDADRARELEKEVLEMNIFDVFPTAFFLLNRLQGSGSYGIAFWLQPLTKWLKALRKKPRSRNWSLSATCFSLIATLGLMASSPEPSSKSHSMSSCLCSTPGRSATNMTSDLQKLRND